MFRGPFPCSHHALTPYNNTRQLAVASTNPAFPFVIKIVHTQEAGLRNHAARWIFTGIVFLPFLFSSPFLALAFSSIQFVGKNSRERNGTNEIIRWSERRFLKIMKRNVFVVKRVERTQGGIRGWSNGRYFSFSLWLLEKRNCRNKWNETIRSLVGGQREFFKIETNCVGWFFFYWYWHFCC